MRTTKKNQQITFKEPVHVDVALEAKARGVTKAALARQALLFFLETNQIAV